MLRINYKSNRTNMEEIEKQEAPKIDTVKEETTPTQEKKSGGCLKGCLIALVILFVIFVIIAIAGYFGYKRVMKSMEQKDLGITYSQQDYDDLMQQVGLDADPSQLCIDCPTPTFSDPHEVSLTVTDEQASAAFEYINQHLSYASISGTQIDISDGEAKLSTKLVFQGKEFPIYMTGSISKDSETSIAGNISSLKAGALPVPASVISLVENTLLDIANEKISSAGDSIRIDSLELTDSGVVFDGLVPTKAE
jgi:uncharacterized protein YpmS